MKAKITGVTKVEQDLSDLDSLISQTHGPDRFVLGGMKSLVSSMYRQEAANKDNTSKTTGAIRQLTETIKILDEKNSKLQKIGVALAFIGTVFTVLQLVQVADILRQWFNL